MVIVRVWLDKQTAQAYTLAFQKILDHCSRSSKTFEVGKTLLGVVIQWCNTELADLNLAVGEHKTAELLKGCKVH